MNSQAVTSAAETIDKIAKISLDNIVCQYHDSMQRKITVTLKLNNTIKKLNLYYDKARY